MKYVSSTETNDIKRKTSYTTVACAKRPRIGPLEIFRLNDEPQVYSRACLLSNWGSGVLREIPMLSNQGTGRK